MSPRTRMWDGGGGVDGGGGAVVAMTGAGMRPTAKGARGVVSTDSIYS